MSVDGFGCHQYLQNPASYATVRASLKDSNINISISLMLDQFVMSELKESSRGSFRRTIITKIAKNSTRPQII